jgi:cytidine deaminase
MNEFDDKELYIAVITKAAECHSKGWTGATALRLVSGEILTHCAPEAQNNVVSIYMEVGAILAAHQKKERVTHCISVARNNSQADYKIMSPSGICQERLAFWGGNVKVAISNPENRLKFQTIKELMPFKWFEAVGE